ncbi:MAG TPA: PspA/IM30 family protein [Opitutales bacterium]|nr:PspA/IM30 family protein [Opitutales bacterium]
MSIFTRFRDIVESSFDTLLAHSDNPSRTLRLMIQEMEDALVEMKSSCAQEMAARAKAVRTADSLSEEAKRWMDRAELAVSRGREDMAREALLRRRGVLASVEASETQLREISEKIRIGQLEIAGVDGKLREARERLAALQKNSAAHKESSPARPPQSAPVPEADGADIEKQILEIRQRLDNNSTK